MEIKLKFLPRGLAFPFFGMIIFLIFVVKEKFFPELYLNLHLGTCSSVFLFTLVIYFAWFLTSSDIFIYHGEFTKQELEEWSKNRKTKLGVFSYTNNGFVYNNNIIIKWDNVSKILLYNTYSGYFDKIYMQIEYNQGEYLSINEDEEGWPQFLIRLEKELVKNLPLEMLNVLSVSNNAFVIYDINE